MQADSGRPQSSFCQYEGQAEVHSQELSEGRVGIRMAWAALDIGQSECLVNPSASGDDGPFTGWPCPLQQFPGASVPQAFQMIGTMAIGERMLRPSHSDLCWHCGEGRSQKVRVPLSQ